MSSSIHPDQLAAAADQQARIDARDESDTSPADYAVHFGVVPITTRSVSVAGQRSPRDPVMYAILPHASLTIEGSWKCWGADDPDDEHDDSLHVTLNPAPDQPLEDQVAGAIRWLRTYILRGRLVDHAIVSTRTWSEQVAVYTIDPTHDDALHAFPEVEV
jgi:hypothetical protein